MVFIDMNFYILTEGRNFKTFLRENYAGTLDSFYMFIEHEIEHSGESAYGVSIN